jgi:hypothetical protein
MDTKLKISESVAGQYNVTRVCSRQVLSARRPGHPQDEHVVCKLMAEAAGRWRHRRQDQTSGIGVKDRQEEDLCGGHRKASHSRRRPTPMDFHWGRELPSRAELIAGEPAL